MKILGKDEFFINSRLAPLMGLGLARIFSGDVLNRLALLVGNQLAKRTDGKLMSSLMTNFSLLKKLPVGHEEVRDLAAQALKNASIGNAELFKAIVGGENRILRHCEMDPELAKQIKNQNKNGMGKIILGPHTLGFDMFLLWFGVQNYPVFALTYSNPRGSYITHNYLRSKFGLDVLPFSLNSLKTAYKKLRKGMNVLTAIDRVNGTGLDLNFFGHKVKIPCAPLVMAYRSNAQVVLGFSHRTGEGRYYAEFGGCYQPVKTGNEEKDIKIFSQKILGEMENFIVKHPEQWMMFHPIINNKAI